MLAPYPVPASIASVMSLETYPVNVDLSAFQQVADLMYQVNMVKKRFQVSTMLSP